MTKKEFSTLAVMGVVTGHVLEEGGFGRIHEVFDHLYPGIMTIGVAAMAANAKAEILRQHPQLATTPSVVEGKWKYAAEQYVLTYGETLEVYGPVNVSNADIESAFAKMGGTDAK